MPTLLNLFAAPLAMMPARKGPGRPVAAARLPLRGSRSCRPWLYPCLALLLSLGSAPAALADCAEQAPTPHCGATPQPAVGPDGQLWVAFVAGEHVYLSRSADAGASFAPAVAVNADPEAIYADGENRPALAFGAAGEIFVAWTRRNAEAYSGDIRFARSLDGGRHFEPVRTVNDDGLLTSHRFVAMVSGTDGAPTLAWLDKRDQVAALAAGQPYVGAALYYTRSEDGGASFLPNRKVADHSCECCRVALAAGAGDEVQVLWRHVFEDGRVRDHATARLGSDGASAPRRATVDQWYLEGCPHHGPALAAAEGGHQLAWFSNGDAARGVLTGFHDAASGHTLHVHTLDSGAGAGHPQLAIQDGVTHVVWKSFDGERMAVRLAQSVDGGRRWSEPRTLASTTAASDHPLLLTLHGRVHLSWHSAAEGYRLLPLPSPRSHSGDRP